MKTFTSLLLTSFLLLLTPSPSQALYVTQYAANVVSAARHRLPYYDYLGFYHPDHYSVLLNDGRYVTVSKSVYDRVVLWEPLPRN